MSYNQYLDFNGDGRHGFFENAVGGFGPQMAGYLGNQMGEMGPMGQFGQMGLNYGMQHFGFQQPQNNQLGGGGLPFGMSPSQLTSMAGQFFY
ncbi:hypothetical protein SNEBB_005521 [Seison nebaliae]|nr:hypothetical protein SNEBB_005521 [Seison nebaliae]